MAAGVQACCVRSLHGRRTRLPDIQHRTSLECHVRPCSLCLASAQAVSAGIRGAGRPEFGPMDPPSRRCAGGRCDRRNPALHLRRRRVPAAVGASAARLASLSVDRFPALLSNGLGGCAHARHVLDIRMEAGRSRRRLQRGSLYDAAASRASPRIPSIQRRESDRAVACRIDRLPYPVTRGDPGLPVVDLLPHGIRLLADAR